MFHLPRTLKDNIKINFRETVCRNQDWNSLSQFVGFCEHCNEIIQFLTKREFFLLIDHHLELNSGPFHFQLK